jgi:hypothetical protein
LEVRIAGGGIWAADKTVQCHQHLIFIPEGCSARFPNWLLGSNPGDNDQPLSGVFDRNPAKELGEGKAEDFLADLASVRPIQ